MNTIYFINDRISIDGKTKEESILLQEQSIKDYLTEHNLHAAVLNPYQLKEYYTIPHALMYDLRRTNKAYDVFIYYSQQTLEDFIYTYPAKWLILKSYFKDIITIKKHTDMGQQQAI
ncbi:hypothetical protein [Bacillus sp. USDA818B3_A]|uniref:hypothetical protein n=1 Tax=Bacillus sp. USDA818B3_A TaxID=2698834 RepID=UPI00136AA2AB|nr:hypothetical protein [Bacillus sp. USDA818B3_A]